MPPPTTHTTRRRASNRCAATPGSRSRTARSDTGTATAELAITMPLLMLTIMLIIQAAVWVHATHIAQAAANRAATTAASHDAAPTAGQDAAAQTLTALGNGVLDNPSITVTRSPTQVRVEIAGTAHTVIPGIRWAARAVAVRPVERFVPDQNTPPGGTP
jgi:Flp pilus assembly protein TadG